MKAVLQRVIHSKVSIEGRVVSEIGKGYIVLFGLIEGDSEKEVDILAEKTDTF